MVAKSQDDWQSKQRESEIDLEAQADALLKGVPFDKTQPAYTEKRLKKKEADKIRRYQRQRGMYGRTRLNEPLTINLDASISCLGPDTTPQLLSSNVIDKLVSVASLTKRQAHVIAQLRLGHSLADVGRELGVSRQTICKMRHAAYLKLQHAAKGYTLEDLQECYEKDVKR